MAYVRNSYRIICLLALVGFFVIIPSLMAPFALMDLGLSQLVRDSIMHTVELLTLESVAISVLFLYIISQTVGFASENTDITFLVLTIAQSAVLSAFLLYISLIVLNDPTLLPQAKENIKYTTGALIIGNLIISIIAINKSLIMEVNICDDKSLILYTIIRRMIVVNGITGMSLEQGILGKNLRIEHGTGIQIISNVMMFGFGNALLDDLENKIGININGRH